MRACPRIARRHTRARVSTPARHLSVVADACLACCLSLTPSPLAGLRCADGQRSRADQAQQGVLAATMIILHRGLNFFLRCAPPPLSPPQRAHVLLHAPPPPASTRCCLYCTLARASLRARRATLRATCVLIGLLACSAAPTAFCLPPTCRCPAQTPRAVADIAFLFCCAVVFFGARVPPLQIEPRPQPEPPPQP